MELLYNDGNKQVYKYIREFQIEMSAEENYSTDMWERLTRRGPFEGLFKQGDIRAETDKSQFYKKKSVIKCFRKQYLQLYNYRNLQVAIVIEFYIM